MNCRVERENPPPALTEVLKKGASAVFKISVTGILCKTFHFPEHLVNVVTSSECDEDTMCPEYKVVAVDVERVSAPVEKKSAQPETVTEK